jgi:BirA family biotin operon repressor/biotin-[acetyl-CoA-carboxylase] ligase
LPDFVYTALEVLARSGSDYVTDSELLETTGLAADQAVEDLERLGIPVDQHPAYGLRIPVSYDLIDRAHVMHSLLDRGIDWRVEGFLQTESTNDLASEAAAKGASDGTTFFAEHQTRGRGRLGRTWHSPVGSGLWFSVLRRHDLAMDKGWRVTLGAGLALAESIDALTTLESSLKWPNDVQIDGKKVAGILTESRAESGRLTHSIVGIGVNVLQDHEEFPPELREIACSLQSVGGRCKRSDLLVEILVRLEGSLAQDPQHLLDRWSDRCSLWGQHVQVQFGETLVEGEAIRLGNDGVLVIGTESGEELSIYTGDVTRVRAST